MAITNATRVADFGSGIGTQGAVLQVDNSNNRLGVGTTNPQAMLQVGTAVSVYGNSGIVSATSFYGDGTNLTNVGVDTATVNTDQLNVIGVTTVGSAVTINSTGIDAVSGIITAATFVAKSSFSGSGINLTALNADQITSGTLASSRVGTLNQNTTGTAGGLTGSPDITVNNITGVAATFTGVLTYEDVTNVDSVGLITARSGIQFGAAGVGGTIRANGDTTLVGVLTATKMVVNENSGFNDADEYLLVKNTGAACNISVVGGTSNHSSVNLGDTDDFNIQKIRSGHSDNSLAFFTNNTSRLHLDNAGRIGINTTTFDDAREALRIQSPTGQTGTFLTILSNEGASSQIFFGDNDFNEGRIDYDHSTNTMGLYTNDSERLLVNDAGVVVTGIASDSKGDLRDISLRSVTGSAATLVAADAGKVVSTNTTGWTVPASTFNEGDTVSLLNNSAGGLVITCSAVTTYLTSDGTTVTSSTLGARGMATLYFVSSSVAYLQGTSLS